MTIRLLILAVCFAGTAAYAQHAMQPEILPLRQPLASMPQELGPWKGVNLPKLPDDILKALGADDYLTRNYIASPRRIVSLYIGFYESQRSGDTIHSPMNCLPGAGWQPMSTSTVQIAIPGQAIPVTAKRVLIEKGTDRQLVLYWYQSHGRSIANEYWSKAYLIYDALRLHRSDAALVRVISPVLTSEDDDAEATRRATEFVEVLAPQLQTYLPS